MNEFQSCLICNSDNLKPMRGYEEHKLCKCNSCKFVFCKAKPTTLELQAYYKSYVRGTSLSSITIKRYNSLLENFEKFRRTNNILDVGCGDGYFLTEAAKRGWVVYGTEYTDEAITVCQGKGINMHKGPISEDTYNHEFFDILTSFEVIEHLNTPKKEVSIYASILRKGGLAYITTPNFNSISRLVLASSWNVIAYPEHLCYYTKSSLKKLFESEKLKLDSISATGISVSRFVRSMSNSNNPKASQLDESIRKKSEQKIIFSILKRSINFLLNLLGAGDALKASFIKQ